MSLHDIAVMGTMNQHCKAERCAILWLMTRQIYCQLKCIDNPLAVSENLWLFGTHGSCAKDMLQSSQLHVVCLCTGQGSAQSEKWSATYPAHEVNINLSGIFFELQQDLIDVLVAGQADHDLQLLHFDIDGIVVLAEEHLQP